MITNFIGDDLPQIIQINRPTNTDEITIVKSVVQVGTLIFEKENPVFPYSISIPREQCNKLLTQNNVNMGVYYQSGNEILFKTCIGKGILPLNAQVIKEKGCN